MFIYGCKQHSCKKRDKFLCRVLCNWKLTVHIKQHAGKVSKAIQQFKNSHSSLLCHQQCKQLMMIPVWSGNMWYCFIKSQCDCSDFVVLSGKNVKRLSASKFSNVSNVGCDVCRHQIELIYLSLTITRQLSFFIVLSLTYGLVEELIQATGDIGTQVDNGHM